jgi:hypothetical protein
MMDDTCLFSDFYLDDAGNLDLKFVRGRWGLDIIQVCTSAMAFITFRRLK